MRRRAAKPSAAHTNPFPEPEILVDLVAENAQLRAALALSISEGVQREIVSKELKHRIGNLLTVVQAIARKTFRHADATQTEDFIARMTALAGAQSVLIESETAPTLLKDVALAALAPHHEFNDRCKVSGPDICLDGRRAHALTLALHELATNAAKYGALSVDRGWVEVVWSDSNAVLELCWRECDGPPVVAPARRGFGSSLITLNLGSAFGGKVDLRFETGGVECRLVAPLAPRLPSVPNA